jgi:predicted dinucleotide-binding enzyme
VAAEVKSIVKGPTAKAFSSVFAATFDEVGAQRVKPTVLFAADDDARGSADQLITDAGFESLFIGELDPAARLIEDSFDLSMAIAGEVGLFYPRYAAPGQL